MPLTADRVQETSATTGTGALTLAGAATGFETFNTAFGVGPRFWYCIQNTSGAAFEIGIGYLSSSTVLVREFVQESSNADALVNFAGATTIFCTQPADSMRNASRGRSTATARGMDMP